MKALMITVYFVGLVNIYTEQTGGPHKIVVPDASSPVWRNSLRLHPHMTHIVIAGLEKGLSDCRVLSGIWTEADETCQVAGIFGAEITLPAALPVTSPVAIPSLQDLCCGKITGIKADYLNKPTMYAVRMTTANSTLNACTDNQRWVSYLTTAGGGPLKIDFQRSSVSKTVTLKSDAVVWILNEPVVHQDGRPRAHFWWYYEMYEGATACTHLPGGPEEPVPCPDSYKSHHPGTSTDVGCSNSSYP